MRILHMINSVHPAEGGTAECVAQIGGYLDTSGDSVEVAACSDRYDDSWVRDFPLKVHGLGPGYGRYSFSPRCAAWLDENLHRFDLLVLNGIWQYQTAAGYYAARRHSKPYFVYAHGMLDPWSRRAQPFKYAKKLAYWAILLRRVLSLANAVLFTSQEESVLAKNFVPFFWQWHSVVVGNGIAAPPAVTVRMRSQLEANYPALRGKIVLLYLARLHEKKGIDLLLRAFAQIRQKCPESHLLICGAGDAAYEKKLRGLASGLALDRHVTWTGLVLKDMKWAAFEAADLFVLPSHQENFGIAIAEALAMGRPVLITKRVNTWREVQASKAGLICDDTVEGISAALARWFAIRQEASPRMRESARECFRRNFSVEEAALAVRSIYAASVSAGKP